MIDTIQSVCAALIQRHWYERVMPAMASICTGLVWWSRIRVGSEGQNGRSALSHDVEGFDGDGQDEETGQGQEAAQCDARAAEVAGFAVVPLKDEPTLNLGWGANLSTIPMASTKYRPKGLRGGEVAVYNLHTSQGAIKIRVSAGIEGQIEITAPMGKNVVVNGGSLEVARKTDPVKVAPGMLAWMEAVSAAIKALTMGATVIPNPADFGLINGGADHFKA